LNRRTVIWEDNLVSDGLEWLDNFANFFQNDSRTPQSEGKTAGSINNRSNTYSAAYHEEFRRRRSEGDTSVYGTGIMSNNYEYYGSTNWLELYYKDYNTTTTHSLNISGGSDRASFSLTGRYYTQDGIYKMGDEKFKSYNLRAKGSVKLNNWITLSNNTSVFKRFYHQPMVTGGSYPLLRQFEQRGQPVYMPYNEDGTLTFAGAACMYGAFTDGSSYQENGKLDVITTTTLKLEPIKNVLKFEGDFTYKAIRSTQLRVSDIQTGYVGEAATDNYNSNSYKSDWRYNTDYVASNIVGTWTPKLGDDHTLNVMAGWNIEKTNYRRLYIQRKGLLDFTRPSFELMDSEEYSIADDGYYRTMVGVFARVNYTLFNRYIFEVAARYDGSSRFPASQRWGFFPSGSIGWRISEEKWMEWSRSWLDNLKFRANVGSLGNASIDDYAFMSLMSISKTSIVLDGSKTSYTMSPSTFIPDSLTWETVTTYDIGLDFDMFRNRLSFSGDYYWRYTDDLLITGPDYPQLLGASSPKGNYGSLKTKGWELSLAWKDNFKLGNKPFNYNVKVSVWDSRTWVEKFYNANGNIYNYYEGKELGEIWGFRTNGYFLSNEEADSWVQDTFHKNGSNFREYAGDLRFIDVNGDGKIDAGSGTLDDHGDLERIGNESPRYYYGINLAANWNGIGLSVFLQGVGKRDWYPGVESGFFWGMYNRPYGYLPTVHTTDAVNVDYSTPNWVVTNASSKPYYTRQVAYAANRNVGPLAYENDYYLQDASYLRLKNITVDYTFPKEWTRKFHVENLKIYVSAENLFTHSPIYKHTKLFDPEVIFNGDTDFDSTFGLSGAGQGYSYPMLKTVTIGLNVTF
jgi:TonB-linked SusC/RagA family outer membrane protein